MTKIMSPSLDTQTNYSVYVLKLYMCEHGMPCTLEINITDGSKQWHVESCLLTTMPMATKLGKVVTYHERLPTIK